MWYVPELSLPSDPCMSAIKTIFNAALVFPSQGACLGLLYFLFFDHGELLIMHCYSLTLFALTRFYFMGQVQRISPLSLIIPGSKKSRRKKKKKDGNYAEVSFALEK